MNEVGRIVEIVINALDPNAPDLRETCLAPAAAVLKVLVDNFPMVSFHKESQRLAVGTTKGVIIIYDLKTATRWHILEVRQILSIDDPELLSDMLCYQLERSRSAGDSNSL